MPLLNPKQAIELFHLILLDYLGRKLDKQKWALKGGCNLRFFFKSPRYSDDMDLDVQDIPVEILRDKTNAIISGRPFKTVLEVRKLSVEHVTEHKQTETTQRWKFGLRVPGLSQPLPTKIEFSRRGLEAGSVFEPVSPEIIRLYDLAPLMAHHYPAPVVWRQKINAILSRSVSQARDVFDLHLLLAAGLKPAANAPAGGEPDIARVKDNILSVDFGQFRSQVVSYLEPDLGPLYDSEETWEAMRWRIIEALGEENR
ncbi:MAG: nucleotidyl transferase AbiEii/AbiGii toxin family protein [Candidatus Aminicenantes bacterium]|nr:nucleotidyl transferase AbiEii/AbiGii toxin family protein [Candidatus Aminicenantes bacterium]